MPTLNEVIVGTFLVTGYAVGIWWCLTWLAQLPVRAGWQRYKTHLPTNLVATLLSTLVLSINPLAETGKPFVVECIDHWSPLVFVLVFCSLMYLYAAFECDDDSPWRDISPVSAPFIYLVDAYVLFIGPPSEAIDSVLRWMVHSNFFFVVVVGLLFAVISAMLVISLQLVNISALSPYLWYPLSGLALLRLLPGCEPVPWLAWHTGVFLLMLAALQAKFIGPDVPQFIVAKLSRRLDAWRARARPGQ